MKMKQIAQETVAALERGSYSLPGGAVVDFSALLRQCVDATRCYDPDELARLRDEVVARPAGIEPTRSEVINETTLQGSERLAARGEFSRIGVLNFASARNPGGGFLGGAQAQEESLARSSGLYTSLLQCPNFYRIHRAQESTLYSDRMIYSPGCPVLRKDDGTWLDRPYLVDFVTSPAPNAGAILKNEPHNLTHVAPVLRERSSKLLAMAAHHGCEALVLGAWGCGVFHNDPELVAQTFRDHLGPDGAFRNMFRMVLFSVLDKSEGKATFKAFEKRFGA